MRPRIAAACLQELLRDRGCPALVAVKPWGITVLRMAEEKVWDWEFVPPRTIWGLREWVRKIEATK